MRKIETQIITAIKNNQDLKVANSEVIACSNVSDVYLHGNLIARIDILAAESYTINQFSLDK